MDDSTGGTGLQVATGGTGTPEGVARVAELRALLDGTRAWARDEVREQVLADPAFAPVWGVDDAAHRERVREQLLLLARKEGGTAVGFPRTVGGEADIGSYVTAFETLAMGDLSLLVKAGVQFGLFGGAVQHLGTERHHRELLPRVISCELLGCFAMTETGHGSNVQQLQTTATYEPGSGEFVVSTPDRSAWKDYIGGAAAHATVAVVFAQLRTLGRGHGVHGFLVPIREHPGGPPLPGVTIEDDGHKAGLNGVDNGRLAFDGVRIPRGNLLDRFARVDEDGTYSSSIEGETKRFFTTIGTLVQGRISVAGGAIGATKRALAIAVRYAEQRRQFGPPDDDGEVHLLRYLAHQRKLLPALATTVALQCAQHEDVDLLHARFSEGVGGEREQRVLESRAAGVKAVATWHATEVIQMCREACGGAGYLAENLLPQLKADTDVFTTFEGDNTVLLQLVAKGLLTDYRDEVGDLSRIGTARVVADLVADAVAERSGARRAVQAIADRLPGGSQEEDVADVRVLRSLVADREAHQLDGLVQRLRSGIERDGGDPFEVFNACQPHVLAAARSHVDRLVLEAFADAVTAMPDGPGRDLAAALVQLHGLVVVERDRGWFLEHGRLTAARAKAVQRRVDELCGDLAPHARAIVDAFGVPEAQLSAPIAQAGAGYGAG